MTDTGASTRTYYGLDIGGTKIELVACDEALDVRYRRRIPTPTQDYEAFLHAVTELIHAADADLGSQCHAIGLGMPGVRDRVTGCQLSSNVPALTGRQVGQDLQARLQRPLHLGNDCQCFALSEAYGGAAADYPSMFGAILGTGAGGGYCLEGRLIAGGNGIAGEWGHWTVPATLLERHALPLLDCACGLRGCMERYVSGSGLEMIHRHLGGERIDAGAVAARAHAGDAIALQALDVHRDLLGHGLAGLVLLLDPHVIVLGGGLSKLEQLYQALPAAIATHLFDGVHVPPILPAAFGDAGGARGAALLARQHSPAS
ncbi:ROK family protein [Luteimonas panaciterrae]|uniref:ROK family protein n=1 Tax=Luteimonas panaciterrae TaxID=363885 RepID=UPI001CFB7635|nr:ROK family protein [Luteimonas panaciterrae]